MQDQTDKELEALVQRENNSLGTVDLNANRPEIDERVKMVVGQQVIELSELTFDGVLYPKGTMIKYRAAHGEEIKHFSMVNESNPVAVDDAMKQMINSCVTIFNPKGQKISYTNILSADRFILALKIREATYPNPPSRLSYEVECSCERKFTIELATDKLVYSEFNEHQEKHFDENESAFIINSPTFGKVKIQPLSLYREQLYKEYVVSKVEKGAKIDTLFGELYWLLINDDNQYDKDIVSTLHTKVREMGEKELAFYIEANKRLSMVPVSQVKDKCTCGQEVRKDITFPNGVKYFFIDTASVDSEFC